MEEAMTSKDKRVERKKKKLIAEFALSQANDAEKHPGEFLDENDVKRIKLESPDKMEKLGEGDFKQMKKKLQERKKYLSQLPRFWLQLAGLNASLSENYDERTPLLMTDVQQLIFYSLCGNDYVQPPYRWCKLQKQNKISNIVILVVEGIDCDDFSANEHFFPKLTNNFPDRVEVVSSLRYGCDLSKDLICIPLTATQKQKLLEKYGNFEAAINSKEVFKLFRFMFPITAEDKSFVKIEFTLPESDLFPRTYLILSIYQMIGENYPLPHMNQMIHVPNGATKSNKEFKTSKKEYKEISVNSPMFAIDCEMCRTKGDPQALTRVCVVNENLEIVYETLVKPKEEITDYLTPFSGITKKMLEGITTTLEDVQNKLDEILPSDAILLGHSLNCDLLALQITHPYVIDTSVIYNISGRREAKSKLQALAEKFLGEQIQMGKSGHSPIEDAITTMKLVKLKLSKGFGFGDALTGAQENPECLNYSLINHSRKASKSVAIIGTESTLKSYTNFAHSDFDTSFQTIQASTPSEIISKLQDSAVTSNFTIGHINLSSKIAKKKEKYMKKIDKWCGKAIDYTSLNGMCIVLFSGTKLNEGEPELNSNEESFSDNNISLSSNDNSFKLEEENQAQKESSSTTPGTSVRRQNGACFVRIKTKVLPPVQ